MWTFLLLLSLSTVFADPQSSYVFLQHDVHDNRNAYKSSLFDHPFNYNSLGPSGGASGHSLFGQSSSFNGFFSHLNQPTPQPPIQQTTVDPITLGCGTPPATCPNTRYRSYDGSCNNLKNPALGTPNTPYVRLLPAQYGDGLMSPAVSKSGKPLPPARVVSLVLFPDVQLEDPKWTLAAMQYGQIITHDMSMIAGSTQAQPHQTKCCTNDGQLLELANSPDHCFPIVVPNDDPFHAQTNTKCMNFVRTITTKDRRCVSEFTPAEQLTVVNHFLDLSIVYGNTDEVARQLRERQGGRMRVDIRHGKQWPPRATNASGSCAIQTPEEACYLAGDTRINQNPQLTLLQIILLREHNRIADVLSKLNPHWDDETIFQEARRIAIAEHQHISYYEWLPIFIGVENSLKNRIIFNTKGHVDDYQETVDPTIINEHSTAAFRYFHSAIAGRLDLVTEHRQSYGNIRLSDWLLRPVVLEQGNNFDDLSRGLMTQPELNNDVFHDSEITHFLFRGNRPFGTDLKSLDIQRNRDHALASYNDLRQFCGLSKAHAFEDFLDVISKENVDKLIQLYGSPDDVDLTVGGSLEAHVPGTLAGPTFLCILTEQFFRTRAGDRFWFEHSEHVNGFTLSQLNELRKASISRLMCDNGHHINSMQPRGFERISHGNDVVPCESLPEVDLSMWKDFAVPSHDDLPSHYDDTSEFLYNGIVSGLSTAQPFFTLNNRNISIYSGAMHYFRVPSEYWRDRLRKMRSSGLNAVETYIPWNLHEPEPGIFDFGNGSTDFQDMLNVEKFLKTAQEEDLFTIIRPGPYICAEWEFGGLPSWLLRSKGLRARTSDKTYLKFVERYFRLLLHILATLQFTKGGPIIAFQIENEYGSLRRSDLKYLKHLKKLLRRHGICELLFTSDGPSVGTTGQMPNILSTGNFQAEPQLELELMQSSQPGKPLLVMEYWTGWFDHWGESHNQIKNADYAYTLGTILKFPASVNLYMFHGGTSFGLMNGANLLTRASGQEGYQPDTTSYDYDAPLSESGDYTDKYYSTKRLINRYNQFRTKLPLMPGLSKRTAYETIEIHSMITLDDIIQKLERIQARTVIPMELLPINNGAGQSYGYIIYRKENIYIPADSLLKISGHVCDTIMVLINGVLKSKVLETVKDLDDFGYYRVNNSYLHLDSEYLNATLDLVVENWGRVNYGTLKQLHSQYKGLWQGPVYLNFTPIEDWSIYPLEFKKKWMNKITSAPIWNRSTFFRGPALYRASLIIHAKPVDTYVDMRNWIKGILIVNGFVLSRYFKLGPQQASYLPAPFLKTGVNDILVFEHFENAEIVRFVNRPLFENIENKQEIYSKTVNIYIED